MRVGGAVVTALAAVFAAAGAAAGKAAPVLESALLEIGRAPAFVSSGGRDGVVAPLYAGELTVPTRAIASYTIPWAQIESAINRPVGLGGEGGISTAKNGIFLSRNGITEASIASWKGAAPTPQFRGNHFEG